ncbi:hypothetical protein L1987_16077 [Smallanthus sonchifolius]|uniref:Uncharacterized protein n=1 Tax=Smallanthus sonchifolius TaxID=185202 RepID=A0ACB9J7D1_9ASTR|nr:hypothetical protein L1987_16077 [Smallanthus sonchifolius]
MAQGSEPSSLEDHSGPHSHVVSTAMEPAPRISSVFIVQTNGASGIAQPVIGFPRGEDHPVSDGVILNLTLTGELVLQDADGSTVWTTNTAGKSIAGLNLTDDGNLVLFDANLSVVWQSFDHPTDCLVPGQRLFVGQQLIPSVSSTNWTARKVCFLFNSLIQVSLLMLDQTQPKPITVLSFYTTRSFAYPLFNIPQTSSAQYIKFMPDGHLKVFEWEIGWVAVVDLFSDGIAGSASIGECDYPMACGRNGICSGNQQCSCPVSSSPRIDYFRAVNDRQPNLGCSEVTLLTCNATQDQIFIALESIRYFNIIADMEKVDIETCKQACVNNCSCKAAIFDNLRGDCFLPFELFTMINVDPYKLNHNVSAFIKVQNVRSPPSSTLGVILTSTIGSVLFLLGVICFLIYIIRKRRRATQTEEESIGEIDGSTMDAESTDFNAKVSDFGLSKLIDRNQTQVKTTRRGTPGYLAPDWLSSVITEKVDVYSFGIVLLETLCGRKKFDGSQPEESCHLLGVLQKCCEQGMLVDMVDKYSEDMQAHSSEVVEMMKVASWCLQYDYMKRPSMSTVVKALEGVMEVKSSLDYNFADPRQQNTAVEHDKDMTPLLASVLSGPR